MQAMLLSQFVELLCRTSLCQLVQQIHPFTLSTVDTTILTVYRRYNYLHCLEKIQLSTLSSIGRTIHTVCRRYNYLHCLEKVQLSTLSREDTTIYTVYNRYSYLHNLQNVHLVVPTVDSVVEICRKSRLSHQNEKQQIPHINYSIAQGYTTNEDSTNFNST